MEAERIIQAIASWAAMQPTMRAVAVVGSHARRTARANSDIDLVLLTTIANELRQNTAWIFAIDWIGSGVRPMKWKDENYGALWSRRVWLEQNAGEVEFGFAAPSWADVGPVDPGTRRVISGGCRILFDPDKLLGRLCNGISRTCQQTGAIAQRQT